MSIITWIENNGINYTLISEIIKNENYCISIVDLVNKYTEETKETKETKEPLTVEIFEHILKTMERAPNTFHNFSNYEIDKETNRWFSKNEKKKDHVDEIKKLKEQLKQSRKENINLKEKFNKISIEDF
mgnify:CR=1 FL=1|tara:strand:- start:251 stop:637 length:387 start_codon:yes stop_codon:yes gene_type:complete